MRSFATVLCAALLITARSNAQETAAASVNSVDTSKIDTNYVLSFKDKLIVALWQSERRFDIHIDQKLSAVPDSLSSGINYIANSNHVTGVSLDYDILGFSFGYRSVPGGNKRTGNTNYSDLGLNINTRKIRIENSIKRYTGFYDLNSANYIPGFNDSTNYYQNPSMNLRLFKSKVIMTTENKKFALGAAYANAKKQIKSKGSWIAVGNFYALSMYSDSSLIPSPVQSYFGPVWDGFNKMNVYAYSAGFGCTYTLAFWKNFYFNFLASIGIERQYRHYYTFPENAHYSYWKTWSASDFRTCLGYNSKRFFIRTSTIYDLNNYESEDFKFDMKFVAGSFDFGYRFNFKPPGFYRKFQESKLYKML